MKTSPVRFFSLVTCLTGMSSPLLVAAPSSDLASPEDRQVTVRIAEQLTRRANPPAAPTVSNPFSPADFETPGEETGNQKPAAGAPAAATAPRSNREILKALALRFPATGTITRGNKILLSTGRKQFEAGQVLMLSEAGQDYEVEIAAVSTTSFTLRYRNEEFTRPILVSITPGP